MQNHLVSVVIPNWNGRELLTQCLPTVLGQTYAPVEVIVVDNGSRDGSAEWVLQNFAGVKLVRSPSNLGFAAGTNLGLRQSAGTFVATLNNDAHVAPDWLAALVRTMEQDPQIGMCASKMLFADRPEMINAAGICLDRAGLAWERRGGEPNNDGEPGPVEVFGPCAGAALYRRAMLDDVGFFDEDFFLYLEDVDLAWRARLRGWRCLYVPDAVVYHVHSASSREGSPFKRQLLGRNKVWTIVKNYPSPALWAYLPAILFYDLSAIFFALLAQRDPHPLFGRLRSLWGLPKMWAKRRAIQRRRTVAWRDLVSFIQPLENPRRVLTRYAHLRPSGKVDEE